MTVNRARSGDVFPFGVLAAWSVATSVFLLHPVRAESAEQTAAGRSAALDKSPDKGANGNGMAALIHFSDGRTQRIELAKKAIAITTPYARLEIPIEDIRTIELSPRLPEESKQKVAAAIARLESRDAKERSAATAELFNLREKSFLALVRASKSNRKELAKRAGELVEDLRPIVPRVILAAPIWDVIETDNSRFAGEIDLTALGPGGARTIEVEANRGDRQVASWVLENGGIVWIGAREIRSERLLPKEDFRIARILLHDRTAPGSINGPYVQGPRRIQFNRDDIDRLGSLTNLTNLEFSSARVTDEVVRRLSKLTSLERLILCGAGITDAGLTSLVGMKRLNRLDLSDTAVTDQGLAEIAKVQSLTNSSFVAEQHKWGEQPHPPDLYVNRTQTTAEGLARLQAALPDCQISASHLFKDQQVPDLVPLPPGPGAPDGNWAGWLLGYHIGNCELFTTARPTVGVRQTEDLARPVHIFKLAFDSPGVQQGWSYPLAKLMIRRLADLPQLRHLSFGHLSSNAFESLHGFQHLESLKITSVDATDDSLQSLAGVAALKTLSLSLPKLTGPGLARLGGLRQLRNLELVDCHALKGTELDGLANLPALETLDLQDSPIDDSAVASLKKLAKLKVLNLTNTHITSNGAAQLARALPKCKILAPTPFPPSSQGTPR
jgi:internalin A